MTRYKDIHDRHMAYHGRMDVTLEQFLQSSQRDEAFRVDAVLSSTDFETTEKVFFQGSNGSEMGPFVRKRLRHIGEGGQPNAYERLLEAQQAGKRFKHLPRVVDLHSSSQETTVVLEWVPGKSLDSLRGIGLSGACSLFQGICDAVSELHEEFDPPIIHRDIKPSNIVVSGKNVALIDLGISRTLNQQASSDTTHFGTRDYAPPEQYGFAQTDQRSDVYALGIILFYVIMGRPPAEHERKGGIKADCLPPSLKGVVEKATSLDPRFRYQTVKELKAAAIEGFLAIGKARPAETPQSTAPGNAPLLSEPLPDSRSTLRKMWGWARNGLAVFLGLCVLALVMTSSLHPPADTSLADLPFWLRTAMHVTLVLVPCISLCVLISDETPLRRRSPFLASVKGAKEVGFWAVLNASSLVLFVILCACATFVS